MCCAQAQFPFDRLITYLIIFSMIFSIRFFFKPRFSVSPIALQDKLKEKSDSASKFECVNQCVCLFRHVGLFRHNFTSVRDILITGEILNIFTVRNDSTYIVYQEISNSSKTKFIKISL